MLIYPVANVRLVRNDIPRIFSKSCYSSNIFSGIFYLIATLVFADTNFPNRNHQLLTHYSARNNSPGKLFRGNGLLVYGCLECARNKCRGINTDLRCNVVILLERHATHAYTSVHLQCWITLDVIKFVYNNPC